MNPTRLLLIALAGEAVLAAIALACVRLIDIPLSMGPRWRGVVVGSAGAVALAIFNLTMLRHGARLPIFRSVDEMYRDVLRPLFARIGWREVVLISMAAGIGEELLFRGVLQPLLGIVPASLLFGLAHFGGAATIGFAVWAAAVGGFLGWLASLGGGLLAPIVAHAGYDALALAYIRWGPEPPGQLSAPDAEGA